MSSELNLSLHQKYLTHIASLVGSRLVSVEKLYSRTTFIDDKWYSSKVKMDIIEI